MAGYPPQFAFLQPLASKCELVYNDNDCAEFIATLSDEERQLYVELYATLVEHSEVDSLIRRIEQGGSEETSEAFRLILLLDYMARHDMIPRDIAKTRFIQWDTRDFDDHGHEW